MGAVPRRGWRQHRADVAALPTAAREVGPPTGVHGRVCRRNRAGVCLEPLLRLQPPHRLAQHAGPAGHLPAAVRRGVGGRRGVGPALGALARSSAPGSCSRHAADDVHPEPGGLHPMTIITAMNADRLPVLPPLRSCSARPAGGRAWLNFQPRQPCRPVKAAACFRVHFSTGDRIASCGPTGLFVLLWSSDAVACIAADGSRRDRTTAPPRTTQ
jgi:hypothetical protein